MNIGIDISQIAYPGSGVARYTSALLKALLPDKTHNYHCFFSSLRGQIPHEIQNLIEETNTRLTKVPIPPTLLSWLWNDSHIISIDSFLPDVELIITSDWTEPPSKKKKLTIIHDMVVFRHPETTTRGVSWQKDSFAPSPNIEETQKKRLSWVTKESTAIIADSISTKDDVVELLGIPETRIMVIYPSVIIKKPTEEDIHRVKARYDIKMPFLFAIGKHEPRKNMERLAEAFTTLQEIDIELLIAGPRGWGDTTIKENPHIRQLGYVEEGDLPALYHLAHGFVFPSLYEGFGYPVAEALTLGIPVACSNNSSVGEIAGDAAILFDPLSKEDIARGLQTLIHNTSERSRCKRNSMKRARMFTPDHFRLQMLSLFKKL
jgi:glycosyltransferase involved in cell wall biosynthesis